MAESATHQDKSNWRNPVALVLVFAVLGLALAAAAGTRKPKGFVITLKQIVTNSAGILEVLVEIENRAGDVRLEPVVRVAAKEALGTTNRAGFRTLLSTRPPYLSYGHEGDLVTYHIVKEFRNETEVRSSTGTNLLMGQTTTLRFAAPTNASFILVVDCWRLPAPPKSAWRVRMENWNASANAKLGIPIIFVRDNWMHQQLGAPLVPKGALTNTAEFNYLGTSIEVSIVGSQ